MIRAALAGIVLAAICGTATAAQSVLDDARTRAICEPAVLEVDRALLTDDGWAEVEKRAAEIPYGKGRLWKVTAPDGAVSHLWGTWHMSDPRISRVPEQLKALISDARLLMVERPAMDATLAEFREQMSGQAWDALTPPLIYRRLPPDAIVALSDRLKVFGLGPEALDWVNPEIVLEILLAAPCNDRLWTGGFPIQDTRIELVAADAGVPIRAVEPREILHQLTRQTRWRDAYRDTMTLYALYGAVPEITATVHRRYIDAEIAWLMAFETAYLTQRFPAVAVAETIESADSFLLTYRNGVMADAILPEIESGGVVVAVGAYHLPGTTGLLSIFASAGYMVDPVTKPDGDPL